MAIFYKNQKFKPVAYTAIGLNKPTIDIKSMTYRPFLGNNLLLS